MNRRTLCAIWATTLALPAVATERAVATEPARAHRLRHDPFDRDAAHPVAQRTATIAAAAALPAVRAADTPSPPAPAEAAPARPPVLRALLRAGSRPMVNVGGTLLEVGDTIDGFRLVAIGEYSARFMRDGGPVEVTLGQGGDR